MVARNKKFVKVFISYCHDSKKHERRILAFADRLRRDGLDCQIDQYVQSPRSGWPLWMEQQIRNSDYVIVVCTESYDRRARGDALAGQGKGVRFETFLTYQDIYENDSKNDKFVPVVFDQNDLKYIPRPLRSFQYYEVDKDDGYEALYRKLTGQPLVVRPKLGRPKKLPTAVNLKRTAVGKENDFDEFVADSKDAVSSSLRHKRSSSTADKMEIEIRIGRDFDSFSHEEQERLVSAIRELLAIRSDLRIKKLVPGSVRMSLELKPEDAGKLLMAVKLGELKKHAVEDAELKKPRRKETQPNADASSPAYSSVDPHWIASRRGMVQYYLKKKWDLTGGDLEDVTQEVMLSALYNLANFEGRGKAGSYLIGIANSVAQAYFRKRGRTQRRSTPLEFARSIGVIFRDDAEASDLARRLKNKIAALPGDYGRVLELIFYKGLKEGESARFLNIPSDKLYRLKSGALRRLREACANDPIFRNLFFAD